MACYENQELFFFNNYGANGLVRMKSVIRITQKNNPVCIRVHPGLYPGRMIRMKTEIRIKLSFKFCIYLVFI